MKRRILLSGAIALMLCAGCINGKTEKDEETSSNVPEIINTEYTENTENTEKIEHTENIEDIESSKSKTEAEVEITTAVSDEEVVSQLLLLPNGRIAVFVIYGTNMEGNNIYDIYIKDAGDNVTQLSPSRMENVTRCNRLEAVYELSYHQNDYVAVLADQETGEREVIYFESGSGKKISLDISALQEYNNIIVADMKEERDELVITYEVGDTSGNIEKQQLSYNLFRDVISKTIDGEVSPVVAADGTKAVCLFTGALAGISTFEVYISEEGEGAWYSTWKQETIDRGENLISTGEPVEFYHLQQGGFLIVMEPGGGGYPCGQIWYCPGIHEDWENVHVDGIKEYEALSIQSITEKEDGIVLSIERRPQGETPWEETYTYLLHNGN